MNRAIPLILFLVLVIGGGLAIGFLTAPGEWYAGLAKPSFKSAELALRAGLDNSLCLDRDCRLAHLAKGRPGAGR